MVTDEYSSKTGFAKTSKTDVFAVRLDGVCNSWKKIPVPGFGTEIAMVLCNSLQFFERKNTHTPLRDPIGNSLLLLFQWRINC